MGERRTALRAGKKRIILESLVSPKAKRILELLSDSKVKLDPTYYLTNTGTGYTSLWKLLETAPSTADDTTIVTFDKDATRYMKVIPGTENTTILSSLPTTFDQYGWRTDSALNGTFAAGSWTFYVTIVTGKYVTTGTLTVQARLWKSPNADGSNATAITDWFIIDNIYSPQSTDTVYNLSGSVSIDAFTLNNEYLFVEYLLDNNNNACGAATGCSYTFRCNEGTNQRIVTTTFTPPVTTPTVTTDAASGIGTTYATLNGNITDTGGENCDERGFEWGTESGVYPNSWTETGSFGTGAFSHQITGLSPNTTYYYRAKAHNSAGWGYGSEQSFTTPSAITEVIAARELPTTYYAQTPCEFRSKVSGATITRTAQSFPHQLIKKGQANELKSKWTE